MRALEAAEGLAPTPKNLSRLAREFGEEQARWAIEQAQLRLRAQVKFAKANEMLFVREALEQATSEGLARYHASLFPESELVVDMTAGIGSDLIAVATRGPAIGYELDPVRLQYARHNLSAYGLEAELRGEDSLAADWKADFAFADPARREGGERTYDPAHFSPRPDAVAKRMSVLRLGAMKLTPMMFDDTLQSLGPHLEFVSYQSECREALVMMGKEARPTIEAVHVETRERLTRLELHGHADEPERYLFEADPAAIRAHALGNFGILGLGDRPGYLTAARVHDAGPWLRTYEVLWHGRYDLGEIKRELKRRHSSTPELKQRGPKLDLPRVRQALKLEGDRPLIVCLWTVGPKIRAAIVSPLDSGV